MIAAPPYRSPVSDASPGPAPHQDQPPDPPGQGRSSGKPRARTSARRFQTRRQHLVGWPLAGMLVLGGCGLVMVGVTTSMVGVVPALIGAFVALVPVAIVVSTVMWIDRWEPEPTLLLISAFLWGVGGATAYALMLNHATGAVTDSILGPEGQVVSTVVGGPLVEESAKGLFVVVLWFRRRSEFNGLVDGFVYAALVAAGFAFTENILYFGSAAEKGAGITALALVFRGLFTPFSHPLFSSMFGFGIGMASRTRSPRGRLAWALSGFAVAVVLHGLWNYSADSNGARFVNNYFLIMVPVFAGTVALVIWQRRREQRIIEVQLPALRREGLVASDEVVWLESLAARRGWIRGVRRAAGTRAAKAVRDYQIAVTELAFLQHRATRVRTTSAVRRARRQRLIEELQDARSTASGGSVLSELGGGD